MSNLDIITKKYIPMILHGKYVFIINSDEGEAITQFMKEKYLIRFHLSEQKAFLSNIAIAMRKSLSQQTIEQINKM